MCRFAAQELLTVKNTKKVLDQTFFFHFFKRDFLVTHKECVNVTEVRVEIKISLHLKLPFWIETLWQEESCPIGG